MEIIGSSIVFFITLFSILQRESLSTGLAGVAITYSMQVLNRLSLLLYVVYVKIILILFSLFHLKILYSFGCGKYNNRLIISDINSFESSYYLCR